MSVFIRRLVLSLFWVAVFFLVTHTAFAEEAVKEVADKKDRVSGLMADINKAREIILQGSGGNPVGRGMLVAALQPVFVSAMFCLGLWAGQMSEKITAIWAMPLIVFGAVLVGAFISAYHTEWKPDLNKEGFPMLAQLSSTDAFAIIVGLLAGAAVGMRLILPAVFAIAIAGAAGLGLGFSQIAEIGEHKNSLIPFWAGFGLTGLLINIFGIGFETFFESIKLNSVTRAVGFATLALSFVLGTKVF